MAESDPSWGSRLSASIFEALKFDDERKRQKLENEQLQSNLDNQKKLQSFYQQKFGQNAPVSADVATTPGMGPGEGGSLGGAASAGSPGGPVRAAPVMAQPSAPVAAQQVPQPQASTPWDQSTAFPTQRAPVPHALELDETGNGPFKAPNDHAPGAPLSVLASPARRRAAADARSANEAQVNQAIVSQVVPQALSVEDLYKRNIGMIGEKAPLDPGEVAYLGTLGESGGRLVTSLMDGYKARIGVNEHALTQAGSEYERGQRNVDRDVDESRKKTGDEERKRHDIEEEGYRRKENDIRDREAGIRGREADLRDSEFKRKKTMEGATPEDAARIAGDKKEAEERGNLRAQKAFGVDRGTMQDNRLKSIKERQAAALQDRASARNDRERQAAEHDQFTATLDLVKEKYGNQSKFILAGFKSGSIPFDQAAEDLNLKPKDEERFMSWLRGPGKTYTMDQPQVPVRQMPSGTPVRAAPVSQSSAPAYDPNTLDNLFRK